MQPLYRFSGAVAALALSALLALLIASIVLRIFGQVIPGSTNIAGYCMAVSFFFGLPYAMAENRHIGVDLITNSLSPGVRRRLAIVTTAIAVVAVAWWAFYIARMAWFSWRFQELSEGGDAWPLWAPQLLIAIGLGLFLFSLIDALRQLVGGKQDLTQEVSHDE